LIVATRVIQAVTTALNVLAKIVESTALRVGAASESLAGIALKPEKLLISDLHTTVGS
jgi:hypothetical protein